MTNGDFTVTGAIDYTGNGGSLTLTVTNCVANINNMINGAYAYYTFNMSASTLYIANSTINSSLNDGASINLTNGSTQYTGSPTTITDGGSVNLDTTGSNLVFDNTSTTEHPYTFESITAQTNKSALLFKYVPATTTPYRYSIASLTVTAYDGTILYYISAQFNLTSDGTNPIPTLGTMVPVTYPDPNGTPTTYYAIGSITPVMCIHEDMLVDTDQGTKKISKIVAGNMVKTLNDTFMPVIYNIKFEKTNIFYKIGKDSFGPNIPNVDFYIHDDHPFLYNGESILARDLVGEIDTVTSVELDKFVNVYSLCCADKIVFQTHNLFVYTWKKELFEEAILNYYVPHIKL